MKCDLLFYLSTQTGRFPFIIFMLMKRIILSFLFMSFLITSCSYRQFSAVATGSSLGGMFGSSIGALSGGWRGYHKGAVAGMIVGGVVGAAVTAPREDTPTREESVYRDDDRYLEPDEVAYGSYNSPRYRTPKTASGAWNDLVVTNLRFLDANGNECLDPNEQATLVMDVYNRGIEPLYNVTPLITCESSRVAVSPAATVESIQPGQGIRYKTSIRASRRLPDEPLLFHVNFGTGKAQVRAKSFRIRTGA